MTVLTATPSSRVLALRAQAPVEATTQTRGLSTEPIIRLEGVRKTYPARDRSASVAALDGVDLAIAEGAIVGVIGRSGAGKSTLIRLINGLERPSEGKVVVDGTAISSLGERGLRQARRSIGMIFQHFNLLSSRTAHGNVALPLEIAGHPRDKIAERVGSLLDLVGLADKRDRYPAELSGGQKQRVGIARALATSPKVLLSDEATSALDPETTSQILSLLKRINEELKLTVLLITHEMAVVKSIADRVAVLEAGKIVEHGPTFDIFAHPRHPTTRSFIGSVTGSRIPEELAARFELLSFPGSRAAIKLVWAGEQAGDHVLSRLARKLSIDFTLLHGQVDSIVGQPFGVLVVAVPDDPMVVAAVLRELDQPGLQAEVLGYVA